jgi:hypothetical protein
MTWTLPTIAAASFIASGINSIAGGGTFLSFPTLTGIGGLSEKIANMTNTIGLWPGQLASVVAGKRELGRLPRGMTVAYSLISIVGGLAGSVLLLYTPAKTFGLVIPWLLAFATAMFAFSKPIARWAGRKHGDRDMKWTLVVAAIQMAVAVYGGYFGAGMGVLMLAGLAFAGLDSLHQINALKVLLSTLINGVAAIVFLFNRGDPVNWHIAGTMTVASIAGGALGMVAARRVKQEQLRAIILLIGVTLTAVYFYKNYAAPAQPPGQGPSRSSAAQLSQVSDSGVLR